MTVAYSLFVNIVISTISLVVSVLALAISGLTAWLTILRRGTVLMTQPTVIFFGPDGDSTKEKPRMKVFLRTLLYATSKRGCIVESIYIRLRRGETSQTFNIWVYGDKNHLNRGSGLHVPESGVVTNHHFLLPADGTDFSFLPGIYKVEVFASIVGESSPRLLHVVNLELNTQEADALKLGTRGVYFDWGPEAGKYHNHIDVKYESDIPDFLREIMR